MAIHVAILKANYIAMILDGRKTVESRLTVRPIAPYRAVQPGDRLYFKASAGPFMATAIACGVNFQADLTPSQVAALHAQYNAAVCGDDDYWRMKQTARYATFIDLASVQPTDRGPAMPPSPGPAWFIITPHEVPADVHGFALPVTGGGLRNHYLRVPRAQRAFPPDAFATDHQSGYPVTLLLPDGSSIDTDIRTDGLMRWRGWSAVFGPASVRVGDEVHFFPVGDRRFVVVPMRIDVKATPRSKRQSTREAPSP